MNPLHDFALLQTRRQFFRSAGLSMGALAFNQLLGSNGLAADAKNYGSAVHPALPGLPHIPPRAKRMIYLHMNGGPSQLDLFDYKPQLQQHFDQELPDSIRNGQRITTMTSGQARFPVAPSMFKFAQYGQSGMWMSELVPHMSTIADDIAMVKTV